MRLSVTENALQWFKTEWGFKEGDSVRVFVRYGGANGFSIGVGKAKPDNVALSTKSSGIMFFITNGDIWYLDSRDLFIDYNQQEDDIVYKLT